MGQAAIPYSLYIIRCRDGSLYTGISTDVARRVSEHEAGARGSKYLRGRGPLALVFSEAVGGRAMASAAEYRVKQLSRARKEALISGRESLVDVLGETETTQVSDSETGAA